MIYTEPLRWTDTEMKGMSELTPQRIAIASAWWRSVAPAQWRDLLEKAEWSQSGQFYIIKGKPVADKEVKLLIIIALLEVIEKEFRARTKLLLSGELELRRWQHEMGEEIANLHTAMWTAGWGGFKRLPDNLGPLSERILYQLQKLNGFAEDIDQHRKNAATDGVIEGRADLYAKAGDGTYEDGRGRAHEEAGYAFERNLLGIAEHCEGCMRETGRGWVPIGELVPIGQRDCLANCKCHLIYSRTA